MIDKSKEKMFCPGLFSLIIYYVIAIIMFICGIIILNFIFNSPQNFENIYENIFTCFGSLILVSVIFFIVFTPIVYVNQFGGYFRIGKRRIPFCDISHVKYNYGFFKFYKYSVFSTVFYFVLKNGEKFRFFTYFDGFEDKIIEKLEDMNFSVKRAKFKDL